MTISVKRAAALVVIVFALASCASMGTVEKAPLDSGVKSTFQADYENVKAATLESVETLNVDVQSTSELSTGFAIYFSKPVSAFSWGEVGRVYVEKGTSGITNVFVTSEKRSQTQITGTTEKTFAGKIFDGINENLNRFAQ